MTVSHEVGKRYHHGVAETSVVGGVFDFFGEQITRVDDTRDVQHDDFLICLDFADLGFAEVEMLDAFAGDGGGPVYASFIVIEDTNGFGSVRHT